MRIAPLRGGSYAESTISWRLFQRDHFMETLSERPFHGDSFRETISWRLFQRDHFMETLMQRAPLRGGGRFSYYFYFITHKGDDYL